MKKFTVIVMLWSISLALCLRFGSLCHSILPPGGYLLAHYIPPAFVKTSAGTPSLVQTASAAGFQASPNPSLSGTSASNTIIATGYAGNSADSLSISGCGGSWTLVSTLTTSDAAWSVWTKTAPGGTCAPTLTSSPNNNNNFLNITECAHCGGGSDITPVASHPASCTNCSTGSITPPSSGDLGFVVVVDFNVSTQTYSGFTNSYTIPTGGQGNGLGGSSWCTAGLASPTGGSSTSTTYTNSSSSSFSDNIIMAFKAN